MRIDLRNVLRANQAPPMFVSSVTILMPPLIHLVHVYAQVAPKPTMTRAQVCVILAQLDKYTILSQDSVKWAVMTHETLERGLAHRIA